MQASTQPRASLSDGDYLNLWTSLRDGQQHVCTRNCEYKQVMGNMFLCATSGVAHVCDQNCNQRIFYDNHTEICRLSKRLFPRATDTDMAGGDALFRKRSSKQEELHHEDPGRLAKRSQSGDWRAQEGSMQQQQIAAGWPPQPQMGWQQ